MREGKIYFNYSSFKFARTSLRSKAVADNEEGIKEVNIFLGLLAPQF